MGPAVEFQSPDLSHLAFTDHDIVAQSMKIHIGCRSGAECVLCMLGLGSDCENKVRGRYYGEMELNLILNRTLCRCSDVTGKQTRSESLKPHLSWNMRADNRTDSQSVLCGTLIQIRNTFITLVKFPQKSLQERTTFKTQNKISYIFLDFCISVCTSIHPSV